MLILVIYILNGLLNILSLVYGWDILNQISKVLMMPLLILFLWERFQFANTIKFIYSALFFSWLGDIFLLLQHQQVGANNTMLFVIGLTSFLLAHIAYSVHFINEIYNQNRVSIVVENPYLLIPFLCFLTVFLYFLNPYLGVMKLPVCIYACCIVVMAITALNRRFSVGSPSFYLVWTGALLFVLSDSSLAINIFYKSQHFLGIVVMLTYILAQLFIVLGVQKGLVAD